MLYPEHAPMGLNFLSKNEVAVKGTSYVGYFFNKKGRLLYSFHLCHILPGIATFVILGRIIDRKKTLLARTIQRTYGLLGP